MKWRWTKVLVFLLGLAPLFWLGWRALNGRLTANPIEFITHYTGDWTLRLVIIGLAITPLRKILKRPKLIQYRRMVGLFAFFYGTLHFLTWIWLDKFFDLHEMWADVIKRRYITVGFTAFALMVPLAVTSTAGWIRRLGGKRWQQLHRLIYVTAVCGVIHYYWLVKSDIRLPVLYAVLVTVVLSWRLRMWKKTPAPARKPAPVTAAQ
ncbi:MAG TPA: protein-methionine-sulfoxide reductase heme-binding subunit MsrQ [Bryobacteraceae bacterium]|nr:protein-methionine-sulfoxide reductase heme-binding subunit MsrQ [Bryobacteraceae bacterium]